MITIVPEGGLCNRMRSVAAARLLSLQAERPLCVHWYRTPDFNARFDAIFKTHALPFRVVERYAMKGFIRSCIRFYEKNAPRLGKVMIRNTEATPDAFDAAAVAAQAQRGDIYIRSFAKFMRSPDMFQVFEPVEPIARRVSALQPGLSEMVAVHIRRTDNRQAIEMSPLSSFIEQMDAQGSAARFFVATDSPESYRALVARYGDRVTELKKRSLSRDDPAALADAVADLYALSSCSKIIGSYWSSFTDTAADLRGIERIIARKA